MRHVVLFFLFVLLAGCKQTEYVTVEKVRTDTTYVTKWQRDSVWLHDSIRVTEKGDTVRIDRWHTKYVEKVTHDTLYQATHDTIPQPYPVVKEVEKKLSKPQKGLMGIGLLSLIISALYIGRRLKRTLMNLVNP